MMEHPSPTITIDVDVANPGQFLACCGLLELASRLDEEALGWFTTGRFHLRGAAGELFKHVHEVDVIPILDDDGSDPPSPPVRFDHPFGLVLDWWEDETATRSGFKTWSGGQTVIGFIDGMRELMRQHGNQNTDLLTRVSAVDKPKPFYFDSRLSRLTAIDMGFSTEKFTASFSPSVEFLTLVGLQRFRPITVKDRERYYGYHTWEQPLPVRIAAAVAHGLSPNLSLQSFTFPLVVRTGGKYKAFGPAIPDRSNHA